MKKKQIGKVIALTGGTRGIGYETARVLLEKGYKVAILYENSLNIANILQEKYSDNILLFQGSIGKAYDVKNFFQATLTRFQKVDILINNAAISNYSFICDSDNSILKKLLDINIYGTLLVTKTFIPAILRTKGLIINISSIWGHKGASCEIAYSMSKGAINQLTSSLGRELGPSGIRAIGIAPGLINTDMNKNIELSGFIDNIPLKRPGDAREITSLILFLIEKATYINGTTIVIDGGYSINYT